MIISEIPMSYVLILTLLIFSIGIVGVLTRKNIIVIFMSVELMLNSVNLLFVGYARMWKNLEGEMAVFFVMAVAAAEAAVGLALVISIFRTFHTVDITKIREMKG
ncbi:MAG: NADH-quinone oxidoreductase subunit NuoK [Spirochaetia bacterium]|nr:NADH-quinone oxidoreductase subunit NuoK [Spirochaetia bacterium]